MTLQSSKMTCVSCQGKKIYEIAENKFEPCEDCKGSGLMPVEYCPLLIEQDYYELIHMARMYFDNGILPEAGGYNDQLVNTMQAIKLAYSDISQLEEEKWRKQMQK